MSTRGDPLDRILRKLSIWLGLEHDDDVLNTLDAQARLHRSRQQAPPAHVEHVPPEEPAQPGHPDDLAPRDTHHM